MLERITEREIKAFEWTMKPWLNKLNEEWSFIQEMEWCQKRRVREWNRMKWGLNENLTRLMKWNAEGKIYKLNWKDKWRKHGAVTYNLI